MKRKLRAFTLVELMVAVVVAGVLLTLAAPSLYGFILVQRLKGINAQLVTDLQFARSEAISRGVDVQFVVAPAASDSTMSCYTIYSDPVSPFDRCNCTLGPAARCANPATREIRTVQVPTSQSVRLSLPSGQRLGFTFTATTGAIRLWPVDVSNPPPDFVIRTGIDANRTFTTRVGPSGRPTVCATAGLTGSPAC